MFINRIVKLFVAGSVLATFAFLIQNTVVKAGNTPNNEPVVTYSNSLELQYAQPWIKASAKPVTTFGNALELQYAQPWIKALAKPVTTFGNALELQYAQPWMLR